MSRQFNHYYAESRFLGLVVGLSKERVPNYLVYASKFDDLVKISVFVGELRIGSWLTITVNTGNFGGEFILDRTNSYGYENGETAPDAKYAHVRFFPQTAENRYDGEVLVTARFGVRLNREKNSLEYVPFHVSSDHFIDEFGLIQQSDQFYDGRSFILETQVSLNGLVVLKVHEDSRHLLNCDRLPDPVVPYNLRLLSETCLLTIMTENGYCEPGPLTEQNAIPVEIEQPITETVEEPESTNSEDVVVESKENETIIDETVNTCNIWNFPERTFLSNIGQSMLERCKTDTGFLDARGTLSALCVVVQKFGKFAILYTAKTDVSNVLVQEETCEGLTEPLKLGAVAFFEVSPRRIGTMDELMPNIPYTHIAERMKPLTPSSLAKIDGFKQQVRSFCGLVEMHVRITLTAPGNVEAFYDDDETTAKSESERTMLILRATNGVRCTIPKQRLVDLVDVNFTAPFDLEAWVVHRKACGSVELHIGKNGRAWRHYRDGKIRELPPLSD